ncbi:MAG TPA: Mur ligase family protein [Gemmatimonadota bacterium]
MKLGLENIRALLDHLGSPDSRYRILHVAGTNGKGSTASYLAAGLRATGLSTGLFTSPHLVDFRERVRVDGEPIGETDVAEIWNEIRPEVGRRNMTFFEANTAIALLHFARRGCEVAVLETGMGGRLDATTATVPAVCVLTRIAFDHRDYLGKSLRAIAGEKAAILRAGAPGFSATQDPAAAGAIRTRGERAGSTVAFVGDPSRVRVESGRTEFTWRGLRVRLAMVGEHQAQNALLALETLSWLLPAVAPAALAQALSTVEVPGRFQRVARPVGPLLLDVAHNPDALACFARTFEDAYRGLPKRVFVAMLRDKDLPGSLAALRRLEGLIPPLLVGCAASAPENRRFRVEDWLALPAPVREGAAWVGGVPAGIAELDRWQAAAPGGVAALVGSFTSVGEEMAVLRVDTLAG